MLVLYFGAKDTLSRIEKIPIIGIIISFIIDFFVAFYYGLMVIFC